MSLKIGNIGIIDMILIVWNYFSAKTITDADYADGLALPENGPA